MQYTNRNARNLYILQKTSISFKIQVFISLYETATFQGYYNLSLTHKWADSWDYGTYRPP